MLEPLRAMGFETLQAFEEVTNCPENVSPKVPPRVCCRVLTSFSR